MCLNLITDENEEIEELLDLIAALQLLSDFGVNMLPVQGIFHIYVEFIREMYVFLFFFLYFDINVESVDGKS
jgi:hypothetical protein